MAKKRLTHIYTGDGKGKTTAAFGLALRACGQNKKVCIFQFLKNPEFSVGETKSGKTLIGIEIIKFDQTHPGFKPKLKKGKRKKYEDKLKVQICKDFDFIREKIKMEKWDMVILDEIINVVSEGYLNEDILIDFIKNKPDVTELVLTGRNASNRLIKLADYVTEMKEIKHPYKKNIKARKGIEY